MLGFREFVAWHVGALGDLVLAVPAIRSMRRAAGSRARVTVLAAGGRGALLRRGGAAHEALDGAATDLAPLFVEGGAPPERLRGRLAGALVGLFFREADVLARNVARFAGRVVVVPPRPPEGVFVHCADWMLRSGGEGSGEVARPRLRPDPASRAEARALLAAAGLAGRPFLAIHPGSGGAGKCWPIERFVEVARRAQADLGLAPLAVTGPVERERDVAIAAALRRAEVPAIDSPPLPALAALLSMAGAYLGNDSGPTHVAAAVGAPSVALFGSPSEPRVFAPRARSRAARVEVIAAPWLADISSDSVIRALLRVIDGGGSCPGAPRPV